MGKVRLRVLSTCSGISAASAAWPAEEFEFVAFADIDGFASEWLHQSKGCGRPRYMPSPDEAGLSSKDVKARRAAIKAVRHLPELGMRPNFGDLSQISDDDLRALGCVDVLEGGTPCQAFSVAGLRAGLADPRGGLLLKFIQLAKRMEVICGLRYVVWENVPGVLSDPSAFGSFLAGFAGGSSMPLQPPGRSWDSCGLVDGPDAAIAWRVLDAQHFGLAQRRARCFALIRLGADDVADPFGVLAECSGVRRDHRPSRGPWEGGADGAGRSADGDRDGGRGAAVARGEEGGAGNEADEGAQAAFKASEGLTFGICDYSTIGTDVCPTLQARADGGGRMEAVAFAVGIGDDPTPKFVGEASPTLRVKREHAVAFPLVGHAEYVADNMNLSPTLRASGGDCGGGSELLLVETHGAEGPVGTLCASGAGTSRPAGQANELDFLIVHSASFSAGNSAEARSIAYTTEGTPPLRAGESGTNQVPTLLSVAKEPSGDIRWIIRRLTPTECERLQGFPDGWTDITVHSTAATKTRAATRKPASDTARYKALGNSMAVPCMRFIGERLAAAHAEALEYARKAA